LNQREQIGCVICDVVANRRSIASGRTTRHRGDEVQPPAGDVLRKLPPMQLDVRFGSRAEKQPRLRRLSERRARSNEGSERRDPCAPREHHDRRGGIIW
jgi:hypothetical protein